VDTTCVLQRSVYTIDVTANSKAFHLRSGSSLQKHRILIRVRLSFTMSQQPRWLSADLENYTSPCLHLKRYIKH